jgi:hypothetical protein
MSSGMVPVGRSLLYHEAYRQNPFIAAGCGSRRKNGHNILLLLKPQDPIRHPSVRPSTDSITHINITDTI